MKKYIFTESQVKKILDNVIEEQYANDGSVEDMFWAQKALNRYFKAKNIKGTWKGYEDGSGHFELGGNQLIQIPADGAWGPKSESAAEIFQKQNGLDADGYMGCCTAKKLIKLGYLDHDLYGKILKFFGSDPCRCKN